MKKLLLILLFSPLVISASAQTDSLSNDSLPIKRALKLNDGWSVSVTGGFYNTYRTLTSIPYRELVVCRNHHESPARTPSIGAEISYRFYRHWRAGAGLRFIQTGFDLSEEQTLNDTLPFELGIACDVYHPLDPTAGFIFVGFWDPRYPYRVDGIHPAQAQLHYRIRYNHLDLPLWIGYSLNYRGWESTLIGGTTINWMMADVSTASMDLPPGAQLLWKNKDDHEPAAGFRRWNCSWLARLQLAYHCNEHWSFSLDAEYQQQLESIFDYRDYAKYVEKHFRYGMSMGAAYTFRS